MTQHKDVLKTTSAKSLAHSGCAPADNTDLQLGLLHRVHDARTSSSYSPPPSYTGLCLSFQRSYCYIISLLLAFWILTTSHLTVDCMVFGYRGRFSPGDIPMDTQTFLYFLTHSPEDICKQAYLRENTRILGYCSSTDRTSRFIHVGLINGYKICQSMFQHQRWNCTFRHSFLNSGYPQASFVWAITTSKAVEEVVMACRRGETDVDCSCPYKSSQRKERRRKKRKREKRNIGIDPNKLTMLNPGKIKEKYGTPTIPSCDDNIRQAIKSIRGFFSDSKNTATQNGFMDKVNFHNRRAGTIIVKKSQSQICNCLGTSGSCAKQICIKGLRRHSRKIETSLNELFREAKQVHKRDELHKKGLASVKKHSKEKLFWIDYEVGKARKARKKHLVYHKTPPNFCNSNNPDGYHGVQDRVCNNTVAQTSPQSCKNLCCSQGSYVHQKQEGTWCDCQLFYNPIKVDCKLCMSEVAVHLCRGR